MNSDSYKKNGCSELENSFKNYIWILEEVTGKWERIINPINIHSFIQQ